MSALSSLLVAGSVPQATTLSTPPPSASEPTALISPPRVVRRSLAQAFASAAPESSSSSSSSSSKGKENENCSLVKRAKVQCAETAVVKAFILRQFKEIPRVKQPGKRVALDKLHLFDPSIFSNFSTHIQSLRGGVCEGRFLDHGYFAIEHSLAMKKPFYHANLVGSDIAAEAPNLKTTEVFWQMVLKHNIESVVMLTQFVPDSCPDYCIGTFGSFTIRCIDETSLYDEGGISRIFKRTLEIQHREKERVTKHIIPHIQVRNWEDDKALPLPTFQELLDSTNGYGKVLAHCVAGIGRTGTFLTARMVHFVVQDGTLEEFIPAYARVVAHARHGSIRTLEQFQSIYTVMESIKANLSAKSKEEKTEAKK